MPHLVILYSSNLEAAASIDHLCHEMASAMMTFKDEKEQQVFPTGGIRVFAYPAPHFAIADGGVRARALGGTGDYGFVYLNLRIAKGRSSATHQAVGDALLAKAKAHLKAIFDERPLGVTLQIDESEGQVFDGKLSTLHPLFK
jgi:5-carboxymethyl-2-hydroxymuconate isomerase